jgi:hypothetical protein
LFGVREPGLYQINSLKNTDRTKWGKQKPKENKQRNKFQGMFD